MITRRLLSVVIVVAALYFVLPAAAHAMQVEGEIAAIDLDGETMMVVKSGNEFTFKCEKFFLEGYKVGDLVNVIYRERPEGKVVVRIKKRVKKVNLGC
jgi:hypothetical protein